MPHDPKNVFIYDTLLAEQIKINGRVVKQPNQVSPKPQKIDGLRIIFADDYETAKAAGVEERIDAGFLNAAQIRQLGHPYDFRLLGRSEIIRLELEQ